MSVKRISRGSARRKKSGWSTGKRCASIRLIQSTSKRKRQISAVACADTASASITLVRPTDAKCSNAGCRR